jgi:hypothetical protein
MIDSLFGTGPATQTPNRGAALAPPPTSQIGPEQGAAPIEKPEENSGEGDVANSAPVKALMTGKPPAVWASTDTPNEGALFVAKNLPAFGQLGLGLYRGKDRVVLFNPQLIPAAKVKALDGAGQLDTLAAPIDTLLAPAADSPAGPESAPGNAPGLSAPAGPVAAAPGPAAPAPAPAPMAGIHASPPSASMARLQQLQPKAPSERPLPGQGAVINGLLRRAS